MHVVARGQTATYEYRYWIDNDTSRTVTGTSESSSWRIAADLSGLSDLPHVFHFQSKDSTGVWSSVISRFFLKQTPATGITGQYWFDNDVSNKHVVSSSELTTAIDVSSLRNGLHILHYQALSSDNDSPVISRMFVRTSTGIELDNVQLCYLFDDQTEFSLKQGRRSGNTYHYDIDVSSLPDSTHTLTYKLMGIGGSGSDTYVSEFMKIAVDSNLIFLTRDTVLLADQRFPEGYSLSINSGVSLTIQGENGMNQNDVTLTMHLPTNGYSQTLSESDNIIVIGNVYERIYTRGMTWYSLSLPFDCDLSRLMTENGTFYAIRYYDGASRAANNVASGNWRDYNVRRDIIPMGTGFIFMTQNDSWTRFYAVDNENKAHVFQSTENNTVLGLAANESESFVHRGWNLVGNPYANYYSIHEMDFGKALTLWNGESYEAVFPNDDELTLRPGQAFFVQCPRGTESINLPGSGRQLTSEVSSGAKARRVAANEGRKRKLINLTLTDNQFTDKTRVVINEEAEEDYELECDAAKFMSMRTEVPQLYSLGTDGTQYAINERPQADGKVRLGVYIPADGEYTLNLTRSDAAETMLTDTETGMSVDLCEESYTFLAQKGTYHSRFTLSVAAETTDIVDITTDNGAERKAGPVYYTLDGRRVEKPGAKGVYLVRNGKHVEKRLVNKNY